jgi:hypothetical protein
MPVDAHVIPETIIPTIAGALAAAHTAQQEFWRWFVHEGVGKAELLYR